MKHIIIQYVELSEYDKIVFEIAYQSDIGMDFGTDGSRIFRNEDFTLESSSRPEVAEERNKLFVRGDDDSFDHDKLTCSIDFFRELAKAVRSYNRFWGEEELPQDNLNYEDFSFIG